MVQRLRLLAWILRTLGPSWILFRIRYLLRLRLGLLEQRAPEHSFLEDEELLARPDFLPIRLEHWAPPPPPGARSPSPCEQRAKANLEGRFLFFSSQWEELGTRIPWHRDPATGEDHPRIHWSRIGDFSGGDIKLTWEPARFAWAYDLGRAYLATGDERYPERFWSLLEDFRAANPPNTGVQWKCGQEVALRGLALGYARQALATSPASTPLRLARLGELLAEGAARIRANLDYALSQDNNHATSEALGLYQAGVLLPDHPEASTWRTLGRETFDQLVQRLFDEDGFFSQYSVNYQRVALHSLVYFLALTSDTSKALSATSRQRLEAAYRLFRRLTCPETGSVPRVGNDDGACILPLSDCEFSDFRPVTQAMGWLHGEQPFPPGPWDELAEQLGIARPSAPSDRPAPRPGTNSGDSLQIHGNQLVSYLEPGGFEAFLRLGRYRFRPYHGDMLHLELRRDGRSLVRDQGTYSYNAPPPWDAPFARAWAHNGVTHGDDEPLERFSPFLLFPWPRCRLLTRESLPNLGLEVVEACHDAYLQRGLAGRVHRILLLWRGRAVATLDHVQGASRAPRQSWNLASPPSWEQSPSGLCPEIRTTLGPQEPSTHLLLTGPGGGFLRHFHGGDLPREGWTAPRYHTREPAHRLEWEAPEPGVPLASCFSNLPLESCFEGGSWSLGDGERALVLYFDPRTGADRLLTRLEAAT